MANLRFVEYKNTKVLYYKSSTLFISNGCKRKVLSWLLPPPPLLSDL